MSRWQTDKPVLCAGALMPDFVVPGTSGPAPGAIGRRRDRRLELAMGGTSGNTAYALRRLGIDTKLLAKVGDDVLGHLLVEDLREIGVAVEWVAFDIDRPTMINIAVVGDDGDRSMFTWPDIESALWRITDRDVPPEIPDEIGWLHVCGATLEHQPAASALGALAERCAAAGIPVSVDLNVRSECFGWDDEFAANIRRVIDVASIVFGSLADEYPLFVDDPRSLVTAERTVIARNGRSGTAMYSVEGEFSLAAHDVTPVDTIGAGDAFDAGFLAAAVLGLDASDCMRWGNACGAYSTQNNGGRSGPDRQALEHMLDSGPRVVQTGAAA
jgi:sugar/nucleoside kinase (ribokinase family)